MRKVDRGERLGAAVGSHEEWGSKTEGLVEGRGKTVD